MRCPDCGFENLSGAERCFKCSAFLGQVSDGDLIPPRKKNNWFASFRYNVSSAFRKLSYRYRINKAVRNLERVSPFVFSFASLLLPGLGQVFNHRYAKAILFFFSYLFLLIWHYWERFQGFYVSGVAFAIFIQSIGNFSIYIIIVHTWIVFDAYVDAIRDREKRRIGVGESAIISLVISLLIYLLIVSLVIQTEGIVTQLRIVNVGTLSGFSIANNDALILDRKYYNRNPVKVGQIVENLNKNRFFIGREPIEGINPGVVLALPGESMNFDKNSIYREESYIAPLPSQWKNAQLPSKIKLPCDRYFVLPAVIPDVFPGVEAFYLDKKSLGGKFVCIFDPPNHRRLLP